MDKQESIVEIRNISKTHSNKSLLKGVNLDIKVGQKIAVVADSKDTLQKLAEILVGNVIFDSGELFIDGLNIKTSRSLIKKKIALVSELNPMLETISIKDNLLRFSDLHDLSLKQADTLVSEFMREHLLEGLQDESVINLELKQLVAFHLIRAQLLKPKIIILDLSGANWSELNEQQVVDLCKEFIDHNQALIVMTKKIHHIEVIAEYIAIIKNGLLVCAGAVEALLRDSVGQRVAITEVCPDDIEYYLKKIRNRYHYQVLNNKIRIFLKDDIEDKEILNYLNSDHIEIRKANLTDMYFRVTENSVGAQIV